PVPITKYCRSRSVAERWIRSSASSVSLIFRDTSRKLELIADPRTELTSRLQPHKVGSGDTDPLQSLNYLLQRQGRVGRGINQKIRLTGWRSDVLCYGYCDSINLGQRGACSQQKHCYRSI